MLAEVDVEDPHRVGGHGVEEREDRLPGNGAALGERPEADRIAAGGQFEKVFRQGDIVPRDPFADFIPGDAVAVQGDPDRAGREGDPFHADIQFLPELRLRQVPEFVFSERADGDGGNAETGDVVGEIGGRPTELRSVREDVPQGFAYAGDQQSFGHV